MLTKLTFKLYNILQRNFQDILPHHYKVVLVKCEENWLRIDWEIRESYYTDVKPHEPQLESLFYCYVL